ncbi:MAG TPA: nuclear transport factor 2 family protein [Thermomicrobiales bacterium]|nr:nuclear transport factor 2 family protein [Thermomicrobiales bacterium]
MTDKNTKQNDKLVSDVTAFEKEWSDAEVRGDRAVLDSILTDEFVGVGPRGFVLTKADWLDRHASGDLKYRSIEVEDIEVHPYGDAVLVTSVQSQDGSYQSHDIKGSFRTSQLMVRDDGHWRLASIQYSPIAGAPNFAAVDAR